MQTVCRSCGDRMETHVRLPWRDQDSAGPRTAWKAGAERRAQPSVPRPCQIGQKTSVTSSHPRGHAPVSLPGRYVTWANPIPLAACAVDGEGREETPPAHAPQGGYMRRIATTLVL